MSLQSGQAEKSKYSIFFSLQIHSRTLDADVGGTYYSAQIRCIKYSPKHMSGEAKA